MSGECFLQAIVRTPIEIAAINLDASAIVIVLRCIARVRILVSIAVIVGGDAQSPHRRSACCSLLVFAALREMILVNSDVVLERGRIWANYPARETAA